MIKRVITSSYAAAIVFTSLQESAISVPPWSALQPPKDGITSPPIPRSDAMSERDDGNEREPLHPFPLTKCKT